MGQGVTVTTLGQSGLRTGDLLVRLWKRTACLGVFVRLLQGLGATIEAFGAWTRDRALPVILGNRGASSSVYTMLLPGKQPLFQAIAGAQRSMRTAPQDPAREMVNSHSAGVLDEAGPPCSHGSGPEARGSARDCRRGHLVSIRIFGEVVDSDREGW